MDVWELNPEGWDRFGWKTLRRGKLRASVTEEGGQYHSLMRPWHLPLQLRKCTGKPSFSVRFDSSCCDSRQNLQMFIIKNCPSFYVMSFIKLYSSNTYYQILTTTNSRYFFSISGNYFASRRTAQYYKRCMRTARSELLVLNANKVSIQTRRSPSEGIYSYMHGKTEATFVKLVYASQIKHCYSIIHFLHRKQRLL
jgi:hypothetical protein